MKKIKKIICMKFIFFACIVASNRHNPEKRPASVFNDSSPLNVSIQKCFCKTGEVWDKQQCTKTDTFIPMVEFEPWSETTINSTYVEVSAISLVQCKSDQLRVPLKAGTFYIIGAGDLFHLFTGLIYQVGDYCIEHVIGRKDNVRLDAVVCISRPKVRRCCPKEHILDSKVLACVYRPNSPFSPPITKEPSILKWTTFDGHAEGLPKCYGSEIYNQVDLENGTEAVLLYRSNGIFLHWMRPPFESSYPYLVGPRDYCVAVEEWENQFYHSALYCDEPLPVRTTTRVLYRRRNKPNREIILFSVIILPVPSN